MDLKDIILIRFGENRGERGFTVEEADLVMDRVEEFILTATLWKMVEKGLVAVDVCDGKVGFQSTEYGRRLAEETFGE